MTSITIPLSDERVAQLRIWAEEAGLPPEEFLRRRVEQLLDRPDQQFQKAVDHLLQKNAELYRRLA
jgi:antitoxin FitA